jgi:hypothetical protein
MSTTITTKPQFQKGQQVRFIGGTGTIKTYSPATAGWNYLIEMEMGPPPTIGRIGYETTIVLSEIDILDD